MGGRLPLRRLGGPQTDGTGSTTPHNPHGSIGKRRPPLVRAPPARSRVFGRTLLTALRPRLDTHTGGGGTSARRPLRSLAFAPPPPAAPVRARPRRPVSPGCPPTERPGAPASQVGHAPRVTLRRLAPPVRQGRLRKLDFSNPPECPQLLAVTNEQLRNGARTVTADNILSSGYSARREGLSVAARAPGGSPSERAHREPRRPRPAEDAGPAAARFSPSPAAEATLRGTARAVRTAPERNRRPTWLILPVAYACLKD